MMRKIGMTTPLPPVVETYEAIWLDGREPSTFVAEPLPQERPKPKREKGGKKQEGEDA